MDIPVTALWGICSGLIGAGAAWGGLLMRSKANAARIEEVKMEHDADLESIRRVLSELAKTQAEHRTETTDRLARIETKIDAVLSKE